jgi:glutamate dehydrogenase (NAD(P)+)
VQDLQSFFWEEEEVNLRLKRIMTRSFDEVYTLATREGVSMREAAYILALRREEEALRYRGIFP